ncbi:MAG: hypothetical protein QM726_10750 [Chitinophagaceae bacterium]
MKTMLLLITLLFVVHCYGQNKTVPTIGAEQYHLSETLLKEWKKDATGCLNLRCKYIDTLQNNRHLVGMPLQQFLTLFGKPSEATNGYFYTYLVCTKCDASLRRDKGYDSAWMVFCFEKGNLVRMIMQLQ